MSVLVDIQCATAHARVPPTEQIRNWATQALADGPENAELAIRIVDEKEGRALNAKWRQQDKATNVLSFPCQQPTNSLLGDIVVCADVVEREASEQGKTMEAHWAHMIVHGTLHLLGHDHVMDEEAERMIRLEQKILSHLGFPDPYIDEDSDHA